MEWIPEGIAEGIAIVGLGFYVIAMFHKDQQRAQNCLLRAIYWELFAGVAYLATRI